VENLEGGWTLTPVAGQDVLVGDALANRLTSQGPAVLLGLAGDDTLRGGRFGGHLFGGPGMDTLHGGLGDDHLGGGTEFDVCVPGGGADDVTGCEIVIAPPPGP
jgi:Ca2+-binding RTX toxin-like protein